MAEIYAGYGPSGRIKCRKESRLESSGRWWLRRPQSRERPLATPFWTPRCGSISTTRGMPTKSRSPSTGYTVKECGPDRRIGSSKKSPSGGTWWRRGTLVFSKGFDSYFGEYRTTGPAIDGTLRTYHETVLLPFPRNPLRVAISTRDAEGPPSRIAEFTVDPSSIDIATEPPRSTTKSQ